MRDARYVGKFVKARSKPGHGAPRSVEGVCELVKGEVVVDGHPVLAGTIRPTINVAELSKKKQPIKDPKGGLTAAGRRKFKRETGANLKPGVKNYNDASLADKKRWISWASRFYGRSTYPPLKDAKGRPTRFALTAAAWGEPVPSTEQEARKIAAKARARSAELAKRDFTDDQRAKLAEEGKAQPDGSYPIVNREDLRNAMRAIGRSKNRALTIRHIKRRAKEMGVSNLPEWIDGNA